MKLKAMSPEEAARRRGLVDELGAIRERLKLVKLDQARDKAITDEIRDTWMDGVAAEMPRTFTGARFVVQVNPCAVERVLNMLKLFKRIGAKAFLSNCGFTLKAFEAAVAPADRAGLVTLEQTGSRKIEVFPAVNEAVAKKAA